MKMTPWEKAEPKELSEIRGVCLDIDDTLSTHGKLTAEAFAALWKLKNAGFAVVPITGRPAGWCDHIARFWPVDAVVGENGAFTFYMDRGGADPGNRKPAVLRRLDTPGGESDPVKRRAALEALGAAIRHRFPHARWASDQAYREFDLAIDFCEDVPAWSEADVRELVKLCTDAGAHAKVSSIHVNAWFGEYDKWGGFEHWVQSGFPGLAGGAAKFSLGAKTPRQEWLFIGDSPNDEPLFKHFDATVGVANLKRFLPDLKSPPRWMTKEISGAGFAQMAEGLCFARSLVRTP